MEGAVFYASKYGSTRQYAHWIAEATGFSAHDIHEAPPNPNDFDILVVGLPVIYHKLLGRKWMRRHLDAILRKPTILFTVSGAPAGAKLDGWIAESLPPEIISHMHHVVLQGRQNPKDLTWFDRIMLIIGGLKNPDRKAGREELHGFDFMDQNSIRPIVEWVDGYLGSERRSEELRAGHRADGELVPEQVR